MIAMKASNKRNLLAETYHKTFSKLNPYQMFDKYWAFISHVVIYKASLLSILTRVLSPIYLPWKWTLFMSPIVESVFSCPCSIVYGRKTTRVTFVVMFFLCVIIQVLFGLWFEVTLVTFVLFLSMLCFLMFSMCLLVPELISHCLRSYGLHIHCSNDLN